VDHLESGAAIILGMGAPAGSDIEYADEITMLKDVEGRQDV
jgi:recombinational DNA repair protein RecR